MHLRVCACRLDAIGAVGIARCFTFGGAKHRVLYDPDVAPREGLTKEQYMAGAAQATTINHFYEKLLKLKVRGGQHALAPLGGLERLQASVCKPSGCIHARTVVTILAAHGRRPSCPACV